MTCCWKDQYIITNVSKVVQRVGCGAVVNHLPTDQQGQRVKQSVDGVSRLVDGHDDGSPVTGHSERTCWMKNRATTVYKKKNPKRMFNLVLYVCDYADFCWSDVPAGV